MNNYRVGKRVGQDRWQIKESPGWRVVEQCDTLHQAAAWLDYRDVDLKEVPVAQSGCRWPSLAECIKTQRSPR